MTEDREELSHGYNKLQKRIKPEKCYSLLHRFVATPVWYSAYKHL